MIIDANELILGRMATVAAKKALQGETVDIINCEKAVISGPKKRIIDAYTRKRKMGMPKGPFLHRTPEKIVRRTIRGMLPYKQPKGKEAYSRVKCYVGMPEEFKDKPISMERASSAKLPLGQTISIKELCKNLGK